MAEAKAEDEAEGDASDDEEDDDEGDDQDEEQADVVERKTEKKKRAAPVPQASAKHTKKKAKHEQKHAPRISRCPAFLPVFDMASTLHARACCLFLFPFPSRYHTALCFIVLFPLLFTKYSLTLRAMGRWIRPVIWTRTRHPRLRVRAGFSIRVLIVSRETPYENRNPPWHRFVILLRCSVLWGRTAYVWGGLNPCGPHSIHMVLAPPTNIVMLFSVPYPIYGMRHLSYSIAFRAYGASNCWLPRTGLALGCCPVYPRV